MRGRCPCTVSNIRKRGNFPTPISTMSRVPSLAALARDAAEPLLRMAEPKDSRSKMHDRAALFWVQRLGVPLDGVAWLIELYLKELIAKGLWAMNNVDARREALFRNRWPRSHPSRSTAQTYGPGFGMLQEHLFREREIPHFTPYLRQVLGLRA